MAPCMLRHMDPAYDAVAWRDLYVFVGGAAAVLTVDVATEPDGVVGP